MDNSYPANTHSFHVLYEQVLKYIDLGEGDVFFQVEGEGGQAVQNGVVEIAGFEHEDTGTTVGEFLDLKVRHGVLNGDIEERGVESSHGGIVYKGRLAGNPVTRVLIRPL